MNLFFVPTVLPVMITHFLLCQLRANYSLKHRLTIVLLLSQLFTVDIMCFHLLSNLLCVRPAFQGTIFTLSTKFEVKMQTDRRRDRNCSLPTKAGLLSDWFPWWHSVSPLHSPALPCPDALHIINININIQCCSTRHQAPRQWRNELTETIMREEFVDHWRWGWLSEPIIKTDN